MPKAIPILQYLYLFLFLYLYLYQCHCGSNPKWLNRRCFPCTLLSAIANCVTQQRLSAVSHSIQCLTCNTADAVCCVTQQTLDDVSHSSQCPLCDSTQQTLSNVLHSRTRLLSDAADIVCCATQQTMSAVSCSRLPALPHSRHCQLCHTAWNICLVA